MSAIKKKTIDAVTVMNENDAKILWDIITQTFGTNWESIEAVNPDGWDLRMLNEIEANSECHEFVSEENAMKELGLS